MPASTNLVSVQSSIDNTKTTLPDFKTISQGSDHNPHLFDLNTLMNGHQAPPIKSSYSLNNTFSHSSNFNQSNNQLLNLGQPNFNISSQPIHYNNPVHTHSTSLDFFGGKQTQQQPSVNINLFVNTINY